MAKPTADTSSHSTAGTVYEILPKDGIETTAHPYSPIVTAKNATSVSGLTLNKATTTISVNNTEYLVATIAPTTASNKNIIWTSSVPAKATVNVYGGVKAIATGTSVITATSVDNGTKTATCTVTVA